MQGILDHRRRRRLALIWIAGGLTAACSTYQPLDGGSQVPWAKAGKVASGSVVAASPVPSAVSLPGDRYMVQRGDRLASLATSFGVSARALADANRLEAPYVIYVGQVLRVPRSAQAARREDERAPPTAASAKVQVAELEDVAVIVEPPVAKPVVATPVWSAGDRYVVRRGETLWAIAQQVGVPMIELAGANQLEPPYEVQAGQRLRIPGPDGGSVQTVAATKVMARQHGAGAPPPLSGRGFLWPANGKVIGGFGATEQGQRRDGIDIAAREGAPVLAAEDGIVAYAGDGIHGYGRLILLRHGEDYITTYAHNAALLVEVGEPVERGQAIARVGTTGNAARSMLYFELRKGRKPIDPEAVLVREGTAVASSE